MRLKVRPQPPAGKKSKVPSAIHKPAPPKPGANLISPKLLITAGVGFVLGIATISILLEPAKRMSSPASPEQSAATPAISNPMPVVAESRDKTIEARQTIASLVSDWAKAWAAKDTDNYLSFYAPEFMPPHGLTRTAWEKQRRSRLSKYRKIEIALSDLTVSLAEDKATVEFVQSFKADGFSETGLLKRLDLKLHGARWMIVKEISQ